MFKSGKPFLLVLVMLSCYFSSAYAQLPQIQTGLNYLTVSQTLDGTWDNGTSLTETTAATVSVIETLKLLNQTASAPYGAGVSWLQAQSPNSVAYIAERSSALGLSNDGGGLLSAVDAVKGAWGGDQGYETDVLDTALALKALKDTNSVDPTMISQTLAYITNTQNLDGGWGFIAGGPSDVYVTSIASATLQQFPQMTTIAAAVGKARAYLLAKQNSDGGFGDSTAFETALAYIALVGDPQTPALSLQSAVGFLVSTQSANGSWNDDPYSTALALKALHYSENKPAPPPPPPAGGKIAGTVIDAVTKAPVSGVSIVLGSNSLINTTSDTSGNFTLSDIPAGLRTVSFTHTGYAAKNASASVVIDSVANLGNVAIVSSYSTGTIAGTIADAAGKPVPNAAITVTGSWSGSTVTGADGSYSFSYVLPGDVTITVAKAGYMSVSSPGTVYPRTKLTFSPRLGTAAPQGTTGTIVGRVVESYWGLPIGHLPEEKGVTLTVSGGISVEPDEGGYFTISGLAANTYQVTVGMHGFASQTFRVTVIPGVSTDLGTIRLEMTVSEMTLTGAITDAMSGVPIPGAEVVIVGSELAGRADFAGTYGISGIKLTAEMTLRVSADGYAGRSLVLKPAPWTHTINVLLMPHITSGSVTGAVVDAASNLPLEGVKLSLADDPTITATTGPDGVFNFASLAQGGQKITLSLPGYSSRVLTTAITPGAVTDVGKIAISTDTLPASVQGKVWDLPANAPYAGVSVKIAGTGAFDSVTSQDGLYRIDNVDPGNVTVATGNIPKPGYGSARFSAHLEPEGLLVFNPILSTSIPVLIDLSVQSDKGVYKVGENAAMAVHLQSRQSVDTPAMLYVQAVDPFGATVFENSSHVILPPDGAMDLPVDVALPVAAAPGNYLVIVSAYAPNGSLLRHAVAGFGVAVSQVAITPALPSAFSEGANAVSFSLVNQGILPVSAGNLVVTLKDPDGQVVSSTSTPFSLDPGQSTNISSTVTFPALKFGNYTLGYAVNDETRNGVATELQVPNSFSIAGLYDDSSRRVRNTANLTVTLSNTGKLNVPAASSGTAATVTVSVPDAGYAATKPVTTIPVVGSAMSTALVFNFIVPDTIGAGQHATKIALTLPSGATLVQSALLTVTESSLSLAPIQGSFSAGGTISPVFSNNGGVDTQAEYSLRLYDSKSALIAEKTATESVMAGSSLATGIVIPTGAVEGAYNLVVNYRDVKTAKDGMMHNPLAITGVKGTLQVRTDKENYLLTENVTGLSTIQNGEIPLQGGTLHLQVVTGPGSEKKKTWTTQADFQTGVRNGVDTYGINDWIVADDDFSSALDLNKWAVTGAVSVNPSGTLFVDSTTVGSFIKGKYSLEGDFDIQVDFQENNSAPWQGVGFAVRANSGSFSIGAGNSVGGGYGTQIAIYDQGVSYNFTGSHASSGRLRLTRVGERIASYYWSGYSWVEILSGTSTQYMDPCYLYFGASRSLGEPGSAVFDNFKVTAGRIKTENQTVDSVRLLPLNDNFDDGVVNEDRWGVSGPKPEESSGAIHLIASATSPSNNMSLRRQLPGDFAAVSVYKKYSSTPSQVTQGRYIMGAGVSGSSFYLNRSTDLVRGGGNFVVSLSNIGDNWHMTGDQPYASDSGRFRLRRGGSTVSTEYWDGNTWVTQHSRYSFPTGGASIWLQCLSQDTLPTIKTDVDSFYTNKGTYTNEGTLALRFDSEVSNNTWGKLFYSADFAAGTTLKLRTRTAETAAGLDTATWSPYVTSSGTQVASPAGRHIEVEAYLATIDSNVTPVLHDISVTYAAQPDEILWEADVPTDLAASGGSQPSPNIGALGLTGKFYLQGTLASSTGQTVASAEYPFYVEQGNIQLLMAPERTIYRAGETVAIAGEVRNASGVAATGLALQIVDKTGATLFNETFDISANGTRPFSFTTRAAGDGIYQVVGAVRQNAIEIARGTEMYEVASPVLTASVTAPETVGEESFVLSVAVTNVGRVSAASVVRVVNDNGDVIGEMQATLAAGESKILQFTDRVYGDTTYSTILTGDLNQTLTSKVNFSVVSSINSVSCKVVADKVSYNPNEQVTLTSTISATSPRENLSASVNVASSQGEVMYTASAEIPVLMQGQAVSVKNYWNSGSHAAGTYVATLKVIDAAGLVVSTTTCNLVINATDNPAALLKGKVQLDTQSVLTGEPVTATYTITNAGNVDVANLSLSVRIVSADGDVLNGFVSEVGPIAIGATQAGTQRMETLNYGARDYLVLLSATLNGVEETLASTFFRVEGAPSAPALFSPANGSDIHTTTPALVVSNAADPNDNKLGYHFEVYTDSNLATPLVSGVVPETLGATTWTVPAPLVENATYTWRARAFDGLLYGPWMSPVSFRVNLANDLPSAPSIASPMSGSAVAVLAPQLAVGNAKDPDSANLTYNFDLAIDPEFSQIVASAVGVSSGPASTVWTVPVSLQENGTYYWRAQADDWLSEGPWSTTARFFVNTFNEPPSVPVITAPAAGSTVASLSIDVAVANSSDPDSAIYYFFEADTAPTFDSAKVMRSAGIAEGSGFTSWPLIGLEDNTRYYLRVKASDGSAESAWSATTSFFANTANDAPSTPVLANPSSGAGVRVFAPVLSVYNASDLDLDPLNYVFELYADQALTDLVARGENIPETPQLTDWQVPVSLTENRTYFWRSRAFDGALHGEWTIPASFTVNTANDAPGAPKVASPADGAGVEVLNPSLAIVNAADPDSDNLSYQFEVYAGASLVSASTAVPEDLSGITSWTPDTPLADDTGYRWRARAYDGDSYGPWTDMASFTVHVPRTSITATIDFDPDTLNRGSNGTWVVVYIELPQGYRPADIDLASVRLDGVVPAEVKPFAIGDHDKDGIADLMVKFRRSDVINRLATGDKVAVEVSGTVGPMNFDGVDIVRVIK